MPALLVSQRTFELLQAEARGRELESELRQAERLQTIGQLTSGIAHDFGNLLGAIAGYAEMAEDLGIELDPGLRRILGEIHGAADRVVRLTGDLLRFSRRARSRPEPIELGALVTAMKDLLSVSMDSRAEVHFELWPAPLPTVMADRGQLEQVLLNLAVNARDAMPEGPGRSVRRPVEPGDLGPAVKPSMRYSHRQSRPPRGEGASP